MIPELGHFTLILAFVIALVQGVVPLIGASRNRAALIAVARPAAHGQFVFMALAFACLTWAFVVNDTVIFTPPGTPPQPREPSPAALPPDAPVLSPSRSLTDDDLACASGGSGRECNVVWACRV